MEIAYNLIMEGAIQDNQIPTPPAQQPFQTTVPPVPQDSQAQIKPAGLWSRFWASMIDGLIIGTPYYLILSLLYSPFVYDFLSVNLPKAYFAVPLFLPILMLLYSAYLTVKKGATWGKDAYGLKVIKYKTDNNISYRQSFLRDLIKSGVYLIPAVSGLFSFINGLTALASSEKRGIHDKIARTQVIKFRNSWGIKKQLLILLPVLIAFLFSFSLYNNIVSAKIFTFRKMYNELNKNTQNESVNLGKIAKEFGGMTKQISQANNTMRSSSINMILNAVNQYMVDNNDVIPTAITESEQKISKSGADLCDILVVEYLATFPVDPKINNGTSLKEADCKTIYSTGYTIFKDASNKITVRAPLAELNVKIEATR
jgi:uncharacterized RDD family membrane protein YckC